MREAGGSRDGDEDGAAATSEVVGRGGGGGGSNGPYLVRALEVGGFRKVIRVSHMLGRLQDASIL